MVWAQDNPGGWRILRSGANPKAVVGSVTHELDHEWSSDGLLSHFLSLPALASRMSPRMTGFKGTVLILAHSSHW